MKIYSHPQDVRYGASEDGRIWTRNNNRWGLRENWKELKQSTDTNGYMSFKTRKNSVRTGYRVHRFMWECIVGPIGDKLVINHKDGNRANNVLSNLEVVTQSENLRLAAAMVGEKNPMATFTDEAIDAMRFLFAHGWSQLAIRRAFCVSSTHICRIVHKKRR